MATLQELLAQRAELDRQIESQKTETRSSAIAQIKKIMEENGLTVGDLSSPVRAVAKPGAKKGGTVAAKYKDGNGNSWSGRGLQPKWLKAAVASGKSLADFAV
jgi:DNA-binding protein H-NS